MARGLGKRPVLTSLLAAGAIVASSVQPATAAVPSFPDNLVVFPDRDFVTIEGFQDHVGETATLEVSRGGQVVGSAKSEVFAGDVAFEVNHPGGVCWGAGTSLKVTPNIVAGDTVAIKFSDGTSADTVVQDAAVDTPSVLVGSTLTINGHIGAGVNQAQMEQRIVNPDLTGTAIGRRDIRAVPGPLAPAPKGGYSSSLEFAGDTFTATYVFDDASVAQIAATGGGERAMTWQAEDADANRQGLTIAEFGELGGPGMGGCPTGPADQAAPAGSFSVVRSAADKTQAQVSWTPAVASPGAAAVDGYSVVAVAAAAGTDGQALLGKRTGASATRTMITGLLADAVYTFEVRSTAGTRMSEPFTPVTAPVDPVPGDVTAPPVTADPAPNGTAVVTASSVKLTTEPGADVYFTTDGTPVISGDLPSDTATLYTGPIPISAQTEVHWVAFDRAGNFTVDSGVYAPAPVDITPAAAPGGFTGTAGQESVALKWNAPASETPITGYQVQAYVGVAPDRIAAGAPVDTTARAVTMSGLTAGTSYTFTVAAVNAGGLGEQSTVGPITVLPVTDRVTITSAKWKARDLRVVGTGSVVGATVTVRTTSAANGPILGTAVVTAPVAPAVVGDYTLRLRNGAVPATNPGRIWLTSTNGGVAGPFTVTNG